LAPVAGAAVSRSVRTLVVTSSFPRHEGDAAGAFLVPWCRAVMAHAGPVAVVAPRGRGRQDAVVGGVTVERVAYAPRRWERLFYEGGAPANLARAGLAPGAALGASAVLAMSRDVLVRDGAVDVVAAHWLVPAGLAAALARQAGGPPFVAWAHGSDVAMLGAWPGGRALARWVATQAAAVVAPCATLARETERMVGWQPGTVRVTPLPVERPDRVTPSRGTRVGYLGRLVAGKGVEVLVRAAAAAGVSVVVAGDGPERSRLEALAVRLGARVAFAGVVTPSQRPAFLAPLAVLAVPSTGHEGAPVVVSEAQAHGVPVLGSRVGGLAEMLPDDALVEPAAPPAWAMALTRALQDGAWRARQRAWGRRRTARLTPRALGPVLADVLRSAAG
jgi:glycosyltransferase involved in cell wall biosynthesis